MALPFLLEIGAEEIPDWMIEPALADLRERFERLLKENGLGGEVAWVDATPRRLVLRADALIARQPDRREWVTGPPKSAAEGAIQGFAKKNGVAVEELQITKTERGEYYSFERHMKGRATVEILWEGLPGIITSLYFPKTMYWTGKGGIRFIRPIRWIAALLGENVVPFEVAGVESGRTTGGHRILGSQTSIEVTIDNYEQKLRDNFVLVHAVERREKIMAGLGPDIQADSALLQTLTYLTEFPTTIRGTFDERYLTLPKEILSTVMRHHQRYFSMVNGDGSLQAAFVAVTNTNGDPDGLIRYGNERVLRARFNDARFFWQVDQQRSLESRLEDLEKVTFHAKLGNYREKTERVVQLAEMLVRSAGKEVDLAALRRAASLSKCDLTTDMVKEFTELQGVVGGLYAEAQGEQEAISVAVYDHYKPVSMEDSIPRTTEGQILSIADKLDTLREYFKIGVTPTGSKDPYALRRAAQGIIKILFEARLAIPIFHFAESKELEDFLRERIAYYLREIRSYPYDEVIAAMAAPLGTLPDLADRLEAIHRVRATPDFEPLAASFKRIKNILKQAQFEGAAVIDRGQLVRGPEEDLFSAFEDVKHKVASSADHYAKLTSIASLRPQVDLFFDKILVNDPDQAIRRNRLALLQSLLTEFSTIADFSEIVPRAAAAAQAPS
jgi:glycyl-tRNA synthetase beta chain